MKDKIVFWFGGDFTQFCMAYYFQKKYDCEMYSIVDITNKPKIFFKNQQLINFKKTWFLHDQYDKDHQKPDINYLKYFEQKYEINLWQLAINERHFYNFNNFHKFSTNEILSITEQICRFYESFFDEVSPDFFITKLTAFYHLELFRIMCKYHGTKVLMLSNPKISNRNIISENDTKIDYIQNLDNVEFTPKTFDELRTDIEKMNSGLPMQKQLMGYWEKHSSHSLISSLEPLMSFLFSPETNSKTHYNYYGRTKFRVVIHSLKLILKRRIRENFLKQNFSFKPEINTPYIFLPLGIIQERHILIGAPFYTNQLEFVRMIAKSIPIGYRLLVKEHPGMWSREWRSISEYKELLKIPNVTMIHPSVSEIELIKNSSLVITTAGTSGFQATLYEKPSMIFSDIFYSYLPSVFRIKSIEELPLTVKKALSTKVDPNDLSKYMKIISENIIDFNFATFLSEFNSIFYHNGGFLDVIIDEKKMETFISDKEPELEYLSKCHIEKIQQHKKFLQDETSNLN